MFSELKNICNETGLAFSDERTALYGEKHGFGVIVYDTGDNYRSEIFCERPFDREPEIINMIVGIAESLPKNTIVSQSCETGQVRVTLEKYNLVQEKIVYLIDFLDKLTSGLEMLGIAGKSYKFPSVRRSEEKTEKGLVKIRLGFDRRSVLGMLGAAIGAAAMTVIAAFLVDVRAEVNAFGLAFEVSAYVFSAAATAVVFADYRFLARKLDACGVIVCPVISVVSVILSGIGAGARACGQKAGVSFAEVLRGLSDYIAEDPDVDKFIMGYTTRGVILSVGVSIIACIFYFNRHPEETILSEKIVGTDKENNGAMQGKRR